MEKEEINVGTVLIFKERQKCNWNEKKKKLQFMDDWYVNIIKFHARDFSLNNSSWLNNDKWQDCYVKTLYDEWNSERTQNI